MKIHYVTTNKGKVSALERSCQPYGITVEQVPLELPEPRANDVQAIAETKAKVAYKQIKKPIVVLDAGFYIFALRGFPRAYVNFALETIGIEGMLRLVVGLPRGCEFRECLAYQDENHATPRYFFSHFPGTLANTPRGELAPHHWSPLALIFIPEGHQQTLAEMSYSDYVTWYETTAAQSADHLFAEWYSALHPSPEV